MRRRLFSGGALGRAPHVSARPMDFWRHSFYDPGERFPVSFKRGIQEKPAPQLRHPHQSEGKTGDAALLDEVRLAHRRKVAADPLGLSLFVAVWRAQGVAVCASEILFLRHPPQTVAVFLQKMTLGSG